MICSLFYPHYLIAVYLFAALFANIRGYNTMLYCMIHCITPLNYVNPIKSLTAKHISMNIKPSIVIKKISNGIVKKIGNVANKK